MLRNRHHMVDLAERDDCAEKQQRERGVSRLTFILRSHPSKGHIHVNMLFEGRCMRPLLFIHQKITGLDS